MKINKENIVTSEMRDVINEKFTGFAFYSLEDRALPDSRDGLKPSQRRILITMHDLKMWSNTTTRKSAKVSGQTIGDYHPHGDIAIYDAMVRMAQDHILRYPLIIGQGNFGNRDGDSAASNRYTEVKLSKYGDLMLEELSEDVVNYIPNYNEEKTEPVILPGKIPNLLINGCSGIAVGWATEMPSHNINEVIQCIKAYIENPNISEEELIEFMPGPDFATPCKIIGKDEILNYYKTGRGSLLLEGDWNIWEEKGRKYITITQLPYGASAKGFAEDIEKLLNDVKNPFTDIDDYKNLSKNDLNIVLRVSKGVNPELAINKLLKMTCLRRRFSPNQTVLLNGKLYDNVGLKFLLKSFIDHRKEVLNLKFKAEAKINSSRIHILEGLIHICNNLDQAIKIIREAETVEIAQNELISKNLVKSTEQAKAVLSITLRQLNKLEINSILEEKEKRGKRLVWLKSVIGIDSQINSLIISEQQEIAKILGDKRRTKIIKQLNEIEDESLIKDEELIISISSDGYVKNTPIINYKMQNRGGKGSKHYTTSEDNIFQLFESGSKEFIMFFTNKGLVYKKKAYEIPQVSKAAKGTHVSNLLNLSENELVTNMINVKKNDQSGYLTIVTKNGLIKKTKISEYDTSLKNSGLTAIKLEGKDQVAFVTFSDGKQDIFLVTSMGNCVRYNENTISTQGRVTQGSRALKLEANDNIVQIVPINKKDKSDIFIVTKGGYGKRTTIEDYKVSKNKNVKGYSVVNKQSLVKNGVVIGACIINDGDSILLATYKGKTIRVDASDIKESGRTTNGVKIISLDQYDYVIKIAKLVYEEKLY